MDGGGLFDDVIPGWHEISKNRIINSIDPKTPKTMLNALLKCLFSISMTKFTKLSLNKFQSYVMFFSVSKYLQKF